MTKTIAKTPTPTPAPLTTAQDAAMDQIDPNDLYALRDLIGLAAFAAEAQRVLCEIDSLAMRMPEVGQALGEHIENWREWTEFSCPLGAVLKRTSAKIDALIEC